jgi:hypothetical protein
LTFVHPRNFNRRVGKRALLGCMLVAAAAGTFWASSRRELERVSSPKPTAVPPAPAPAMAVAPSAPVEPSGMDGSFVMPQVTFDSGFCAPEGDETIELRYSLRRLLIEELRRRLQPDGGDAGDAPSLSLLMQAIDPGAPREDLLRAAEQASHETPDSPFPYLIIAIAAGSADPQARLTALRQARRLLPRDPAVGWAIADATYESPDLDEAIEGLSVYLASVDSPGMARLRARLEMQRDIQRGDLRKERNGVTMLWPQGSLSYPQADELLTAVDRGLDEAARFTGSPRRGPLTVVVYPGRSELLAVSCARSWTAALFDGTLRVVAPPDSGTVDWTVLRHETLHAQLSPMAPRAPKWFHEGVAQSFAQESGRERKWRLMVRNHVWVPFASLDSSFQAFDSDSDADLVYAQSYAMVELMRECGGDGALDTALAAFASGADTPTALARACHGEEVTGKDLLDFLERRLAQRDAPS